MTGELKHGFGEYENDKAFNLRVNQNWGILKELIATNFDKKNLFVKRVVFRLIGKHPQQAKNENSAIEQARLRQDFRTLFIMDAKAILENVCRRNFAEYLNLEKAYHNQEAHIFKSYLNYHLPEEGMAPMGDTEMSAITIKLGAKTDSQEAGDEMFIRFPAPEKLILDDDTEEEEVRRWFDSINEIFVEYDHITDLDFEVDVRSISKEGSRSLNPEDIMVNVDDFDQLTDEKARQFSEKLELGKLETLYKKLATMQIVPFDTTEIRK